MNLGEFLTTVFVLLATSGNIQTDGYVTDNTCGRCVAAIDDLFTATANVSGKVDWRSIVCEKFQVYTNSCLSDLTSVEDATFFTGNRSRICISLKMCEANGTEQNNTESTEPVVLNRTAHCQEKHHPASDSRCHSCVQLTNYISSVFTTALNPIMSVLCSKISSDCSYFTSGLFQANLESFSKQGILQNICKMIGACLHTDWRTTLKSIISCEQCVTYLVTAMHVKPHGPLTHLNQSISTFCQLVSADSFMCAQSLQNISARIRTLRPLSDPTEICTAYGFCTAQQSVEDMGMTSSAESSQPVLPNNATEAGQMNITSQKT